MRTKIFLLLLVAAVALPLTATQAEVPERPTFTKDVLPILQNRCQICHRQGGENVAGMVAPMSLLSYREVRPWAKAVAKAVETKNMPPWDATDATIGQFKNEPKFNSTKILRLITYYQTVFWNGSMIVLQMSDNLQFIPIPLVINQFFVKWQN